MGGLGIECILAATRRFDIPTFIKRNAMNDENNRIMTVLGFRDDNKVLSFSLSFCVLAAG